MKNINKENLNPELILSVSQKLSRNGVLLYNNLFKINNLNYVYKSIAVDSLNGFIDAFKYINVYGASIASPFKIEIIKQLDKLSKVAEATNSVNSIKKYNDKLIGHNTDVLGLIKIFQNFSNESSHAPHNFIIYGSGGVVSSIIYAINEVFQNHKIYICGRNAEKVSALAKKHKLHVVEPTNSINADLWINATPGSITHPIDLLYFCNNASAVFDLNPVLNSYEFENEVKKRGQKFIRGFDFYIEQFLEQYHFYTGHKVVITDIQEIIKIRMGD